MPDRQYSYRFYDAGTTFINPLSRDEVLDKMRHDLAVIPVERTRLPHGAWGPWRDSDELTHGGSGEAQEGAK